MEAKDLNCDDIKYRQIRVRHFHPHAKLWGITDATAFNGARSPSSLAASGGGGGAV